MAATRASFSITTEGKLILIKTIGSQTAEAVQSIRHRVEEILAQPKAPQDILVDIGNAAVPDQKSVEVTVRFLQETPFRRMAIFNARPNLMLLASTIFKESDTTNERLKIFRDEHLARAWLSQTPRKSK